MAGTAFVIRVTGAVVIFLSQILLARWMGGVEFGIYVYAWTWLQMVGDIIHLGLPLTAQRTIPEYTQRNDLDGLRGFLIGSRWIVFATATMVAVLGALAVHALEPSLDRGTIMPLYLACVALPLYPVSNMLDGLARPYNAVNIALLPPFVLRPLMLIAAMAAAHRVRHCRRRHDRRWPRSRSPPGRRRCSSSSCSTAAWRSECRPGRGATISARGSGPRARSSRSGPSTCC